MFQSDLFPADEQLPSMPLAYAIGTRVAALLVSGRHLTRSDSSGLFAEETGALDWGSAWTIDDYNSAVEIGALLWLRESSRIDLTRTCMKQKRVSTGSRQPCRPVTFVAKHRSSSSSSRPRRFWPG